MFDYPATVTPSTAEYCALAGSSEEHLARQVRYGTDLCGPCHASLPYRLLDLAGMVEELPEAVVRLPGTKFDYDRVAQGQLATDVQGTWNPAAARVLADIEFFARRLTIVLYREYPAGCSIPVRIPAWDLHSLQLATTPKQALLSIRSHARWLSEYPHVGDGIVRQARRLCYAGRRALDPDAPRVQRRRTMFLCTDVVDESDDEVVPCDAPMWRIIPPEDSRVDEEIVCERTLLGEAEHTRYQPDEWLSLHVPG